MKLALFLFTTLALAVCDTAGGQLSLTFLALENPDGVAESHEVCPAGSSCVNMQSGPDGWSKKVDQVFMARKTCIRFFKSYGCPVGEEVWQPGCPGGNWGELVPLDWQDGAMKSYTVWHC